MKTYKPVRDYSALVSGEKSTDKPVKWHKKVLLQLATYIALCVISVLWLPNNIWNPELKLITITLGILEDLGFTVNYDSIYVTSVGKHMRII